MSCYEVMQRDIPAWYELSMSGNSLIIRVHEIAAKYVEKKLLSSLPVIQHLNSEPKIPDFIEPKNDIWGFGEVIIRKKDTDDNWIIWECPLPIIHDSKNNYYWERAYATSATLQMLFMTFTLVEKETNCPLFQLLMISNLSTTMTLHGGSLEVMLSRSLCYWLNKQGEIEHPEISRVMIRIYEYLWQEKLDSHQKQMFVAKIRQPKWINFNCPGKSCGLDPKDYYPKSLDKGYELLPHNVDTTLQQFTLLSGIATLHQLAREDGY